MHRLTFVLVVLCLIAAPASFAAAVSGTVYHDADLSSTSHYNQSVEGDDALLPGIGVDLIDADGDVATTTTSDTGRFSFDAEPGYYLLDPDMDGYELTSHNVAPHVAAAVRDGAVTIVHIGDSIGVTGDDPFPTRLAWHFAELAEVTLYNVARGGSRSWEWLPGDDKGYYEDRLLPVLPEADVVTVTITGNDLDAYVEGLEPPYDIGAIIQLFLDNPQYLFDAVPRLEQLLEAIRGDNPDCDVMFVGYPNFANSTLIQSYTGELLQPVAALLFDLVMASERDAAAGIDGVLTTDMNGFYEDTWLDDYLIDEVHPSPQGSQDYADQVFLALGGVIVGGKSLGEDRGIGYYAPDLAPPPPADDDDDIGDDDDAGDDDTPDPDGNDDDTGDDDAPADTGDDDDDEGGCGN